MALRWHPHSSPNIYRGEKLEIWRRFSTQVAFQSLWFQKRVIIIIIISLFATSSVKHRYNKENMKYRRLPEEAKAQQSWPPESDTHGQI